MLLYITPSVSDEHMTQEEFLRQYDSYSDKIYRYCYYRVYDQEFARDLVQDVFMKTWRYLVQGNTIEYMQAFLYRTATNCIINESKRKGRSVSLDQLQEEKNFDVRDESVQDPGKKFDTQKIIDTLGQLLDDSDREVIILRYINDLPLKDIADITGESTNVISVRLHRALKKLHDILGKDTI